jgi:hypothetical protein
MAILRASFLSDPELPAHGPTLLITFNKSLSAYIRSLAAAELANVRVEHYHKFARGYLSAQRLMGRDAVVPVSRRSGLIQAGIDAIKGKYRPHRLFDRPLNFFAAEIGWLMKHGIRSLDDYTAQNRVGRAEARLPHAKSAMRTLPLLMVPPVSSQIRARRIAAVTASF